MFKKYEVIEHDIDLSGRYIYRIVIDDNETTSFFYFSEIPTEDQIRDVVDRYNQSMIPVEPPQEV